MEGLTGTGEEKRWARQLASLPMRLGGLGLRSAVRMAPNCILGIVGRCIAHVPREASAIGSDHCGEIGRSTM